MKKRSTLVAIPLLMAFLSAGAFAFDFTEADRLFDARENNLQNIADARAIYQKALLEAKGEELIHAVDHLGKLAYYEGELLTDEGDSKKRVAIFSQCQNDVDTISPAKLGEENPVYYYWRSACTALWGKSANSFSVLGHLSELKRLMQRGMEVAPDYAGGGMLRVVAGVYIGSKMLRFIPGLSDLYNPSKALEYVNKALMMSNDYYNAPIVKAEAMRALGEKDAATVYLKDKKQELEKRVRTNNLPKGLEPESRKHLEQMNKLLASW